MTSEKKAAASRANGAKSRGPKTPEGKARSSRNATRHSLLSRVIVLEEEPADAFKRLFFAYAERFGPLDPVETGMVEEMVATYWRMRRAWAIENRLLDTEMATQSGDTATDRLMTAFTSLSDSNKLNLLHRYETRLHTMFQRAFRNLLMLRSCRPPAYTTEQSSVVPHDAAIAFPYSAERPPTQTRAIPNEPTNSPISNKSPKNEPETNLNRTQSPNSLDTTQEAS